MVSFDELPLSVIVPVRMTLRLERRLHAVRDSAAALEPWTAEFVSAAVRPSFSFAHSCSLTRLSLVPLTPPPPPTLTSLRSTSGRRMAFGWDAPWSRSSTGGGPGAPRRR